MAGVYVGRVQHWINQSIRARAHNSSAINYSPFIFLTELEISLKFKDIVMKLNKLYSNISFHLILKVKDFINDKTSNQYVTAHIVRWVCEHIESHRFYCLQQFEFG